MKKLAIVISVLALITSCSSTKITTDQVSNVNFSDYKTYSVSQIINQSEPQHFNAINSQRVQNAIQNEASKRELLLSDDPSLQIVWGFGIDVQKSYSTSTNYHRNGSAGFRGRHGGFGTASSYSDTQEHDTTKAKLHIAIIDSESDQVIWTGIAENEFKGNNKKAEEKINEVIRMVFEEFPI